MKKDCNEIRVKRDEAVAGEVRAGVIYLLCAGLSLLPIGFMKVSNMYHPLVAFFSYVLASFSLILLLMELLSFFLGKVLDEEEAEE
jgi:hypothetical protein